MDTVEGRVLRITEILDDVKAEEIVALDLRGVVDFTDFFVIATMRSPMQMRAVAAQVFSLLKTEGVRPFAPIEDESPHWTILDYGSVVIHLFDSDTRRHYRLEELWGDAEPYDWQSQATA